MKRHKLTIMLISAAFLPALLFICAEGQQKRPGKNEGHAKEAKGPMLRHAYAEVNGVRLHYVTAGKPDGTHWVIHEQPALINRYIREFIKGN